MDTSPLIAFTIALGIAFPTHAATIHLEKSEAWSPHQLAAAKTSQQGDGSVRIDGNGTGTCTGGWQFTYSGITGGQAYRLSTHAAHRELANARDSLVAVALWGKWDAASERTQMVPYNYLLPKQTSASGTDFESIVRAPEGASELTVRYIFRWSSNGSSTWSAPHIETTTIAEPKPVKVCIVSNGAKVTAKTKHPMSIQGLGLAPEVEKSVNLWAGLILDACDRKPQLIVTPEVIIGGPNPLQNAITVPGPATQPFEKIAREHQVHLMLSVYERAGDARHNSTVLISPEGKVVGVYRKVHLATSEGWSGLTPGSSFPVFPTEIGRIGSVVCMDTMLPESSRMLALNGADIICLPIMGDLRADRLTPGSPHFNEDRWKAVMRTRALDNQATMVIARNEGHGSCIISARGDILAWNEGDQSIIEATIPTDPIRYWDGGDVGETTYLLRRPHVYEAFTKDEVLGPLSPKPADTKTSTLTP
ncbi:MAG: carbon-nitrogen hydrolase family protein [Verrucomicrobiaceae bacterium]|nr:carbon-nitrogen hydrolase family protein [Verrucomicrobiaceae bacterium]